MTTETIEQLPTGIEHKRAATLLSFLVIVCQLLALMKIVQVFEIEHRRQFLPLMCLAAVGFLIHSGLPPTRRPLFFLALSLVGFVLLLGVQSALLIVGIGLLLISVCHLPIRLRWRVVIVGLVAGALAYYRTAQPLPFWTILGSIFMFRLPIYLREMNGPKTLTPWPQRLSYFFLLPNACFSFFPLIDYQVFVKSYRHVEDLVAAQRGIAWITRGIIHLLLYRLVKYHFLLPPDEILNVSDVTLFMVGNYALYLHVSGTFHLITGILHLFGFDLPRTHEWFFLAHSFTDIWRRINIYWKNFLAQQIFYPAFFRLRVAGAGIGIVAATVVTFVCTWLLHSYQVFWLLGDFPVRGTEAMLWITAGLFVAVNSVIDYQVARRHKLQRATMSVGLALRKSLQIVAIFLCVSFFWSCWSYPMTLPALWGLSQRQSNFSDGWMQLVIAILLVIGILTPALYFHSRWSQRGWPFPLRFDRSPVPVLTLCACLLLLGQPTVQQSFHTDTTRVLESLTVDYPTTLELVQAVPGYYEDLTEPTVQSDAFFAYKPPPKRVKLHYPEMTRSRNDLIEFELIPGWEGIMEGQRTSVNRWGMRDGPVSRSKPANTTRIAVVGSSVVMGYGVPDHAVFTEIVERRMNERTSTGGHRVEMLNFGAGGYYPLHIAAALREKVYAFEPDAVYYIAHQGEFYGPPKHVALHRFARRNLQYGCIDQILRDAGVTDETSQGTIEALLYPRSKRLTGCIYEGIVSDCRERNILPVWIYLPMPGIVQVSIETEEIVALAKSAGFVTIDLSHWSDGRTPEEVKLSKTDFHANLLGHQIMADVVYKAIVEQPEILPVPRK